MYSSSAYAAPLLINLAPSRIECLLLCVALAFTVIALFVAQIDPPTRAVLSLLACLLLVQAWRRVVTRPLNLMLYGDGLVDCATPDSALRMPAELLQASWYGPIPHCEFRILGDRRVHALALFSDRLDQHSRQRLRVWLATHRPQSLDVVADDAGSST